MACTSPAGHINPPADKSTHNSLLSLWEQAHKMAAHVPLIKNRQARHRQVSVLINTLLSALGGKKNG
jgi:hypothetical protein